MSPSNKASGLRGDPDLGPGQAHGEAEEGSGDRATDKTQVPTAQREVSQPRLQQW